MVNAAIENGMYVNIDYHAHRAEDSRAQAIEFFTEMARFYGGFNHVIYEVYNEPVNTGWPAINDYAEDVIAAIRAVDPDNLIIVGTRFFSRKSKKLQTTPSPTTLPTPCISMQPATARTCATRPCAP